MKIAIHMLTLALLLGSCKKDAELTVKPVKEFKPYSIEGFAIAPLEQYFDGVKVRELYGPLSQYVVSQVAFEKDETLMELKQKGSGEVLYQQTFRISDTENKVPKFYFDGTKLNRQYTYPAPQGKQYHANFYLDFPKDSGAVDIVMEVLELYYDWNLDEPEIFLDTTSIPIATNLKTGQWSPYFEVLPAPNLPTHHPESEFQTRIIVKKAGTNKYYAAERMDQNMIALQLPQSWTTVGKVQSIFIGWKQMGISARLSPQQDLVQLFQ